MRWVFFCCCKVTCRFSLCSHGWGSFFFFFCIRRALDFHSDTLFWVDIKSLSGTHQSRADRRPMNKDNTTLVSASCEDSSMCRQRACLSDLSHPDTHMANRELLPTRSWTISNSHGNFLFILNSFCFCTVCYQQNFMISITEVFVVVGYYSQLHSRTNFPFQFH